MQHVFARDRADLGPAAAAQRAAEDIERYGTQPPTRPLEEALGDLWAAWTREADLQERHHRLVDQRDALQHVAAIHARYTPQRDRLRDDASNARQAWLQARQQVADLDTALQTKTADLRSRIWGAWHQELVQARRTAEVVRDGAGRLGQHRRQVREASTELAAFAQRWHPAVPDLPTDPAELADQVMWLHGRLVEGPINAYIDRQVADAHPHADQICKAERDADTACNRAEGSRTQLQEAMHAELSPYGLTAHARDATGRLDAVVDELAAVEGDLRTASSRVQALTSEPSLRTLPTGGLDGEHDRWAADRLA